MHELVTVDFDLGPEFVGWMAEVAGTTVCVAAPGMEQDPPSRRIMSDMVTRRGGDCSTCRGCQIGRDM